MTDTRRICNPSEMHLHQPAQSDGRRLSPPEIPGGDPRSFGGGAEFRPHDGRVGDAAEAAVGAGDYVFTAYEVGVADQPLGDQLGVFDELGGAGPAPRA